MNKYFRTTKQLSLILILALGIHFPLKGFCAGVLPKDTAIGLRHDHIFEDTDIIQYLYCYSDDSIHFEICKRDYKPPKHYEKGNWTNITVGADIYKNGDSLNIPWFDNLTYNIYIPKGIYHKISVAGWMTMLVKGPASIFLAPQRADIAITGEAIVFPISRTFIYSNHFAVDCLGSKSGITKPVFVSDQGDGVAHVDTSFYSLFDSPQLNNFRGRPNDPLPLKVFNKCAHISDFYFSQDINWRLQHEGYNLLSLYYCFDTIAKICNAKLLRNVVWDGFVDKVWGEKPIEFPVSSFEFIKMLARRKLYLTVECGNLVLSNYCYCLL